MRYLKLYQEELRQVFKINGSTSREYFLVYLVCNAFVVYGIASLLSGFVDGFSSLFTGVDWSIYWFLLVITSVGITMRRVTDAGFHMLLALIPIANLVLVCLPTKKK